MRVSILAEGGMVVEGEGRRGRGRGRGRGGADGGVKV